MAAKKKTEKPETADITVPLREARRVSAKYRAKKAVAVLKKQIKKHFRTDNIKISGAINRQLWKQSAYFVSPQITVTVLREKEGVRVFPAKTKDLDEYLKEKQAKEKEKKKEKEEEKKEEKAQTKEEKEKAKIEEKEREEKLAEKKAKEEAARSQEHK